MIRNVLIAIAVLALAIGIEFGVLPLFGDPWGPIRFPEARVVALCVIVFGCLRGELAALPFAIAAGALAGSARGEGYLGCTLVSFTFAGFVAAGASRWFYFDQFSIRLLVLFGLIVIESWMWSFTRHLFWPQSPVEIQWAIHGIVALLGAVFYIPLVRWFGRRMAPAESIGRRRKTE